MNTPYHIAYVMQVAAVAAGLYTVGCLSDAYQSQVSAQPNYILLPSSAYNAAVWIERERTLTKTGTDAEFLQNIGRSGLKLAARYPLTSGDLIRRGVVRLHAKKSPFMACVQYAIHTMHIRSTVSAKRHNMRPDVTDYIAFLGTGSRLGLTEKRNPTAPIVVSKDISMISALDDTIKSLCLSASDFISNGPETMTDTQSILIGSMARILWGSAMNFEPDAKRPDENGFAFLSIVDDAGWFDMQSHQTRIISNIKAMGDIVHSLKTGDSVEFEGKPYQSRDTRVSDFLTGDVIHTSDDMIVGTMNTDGFISGFCGNRIVINSVDEVAAHCRIPSISTGIRWGHLARKAFS